MLSMRAVGMKQPEAGWFSNYHFCFSALDASRGDEALLLLLVSTFPAVVSFSALDASRGDEATCRPLTRSFTAIRFSALDEGWSKHKIGAEWGGAWVCAARGREAERHKT